MNDMQNIQAYVPQVSLWELIPFGVVLLGAIATLLADAATDKHGSRRILPIITGVTLVLAMVGFFANMLPNAPFVESTFRADEFGQLGCLVILFSALMMTVMAPSLVERRNLPSGEFYALILFATFGAITLALANELLTAFVCLETMSLSLYVLTGIDRRSGKAAEASFKYFILGAFASAFLVLGIAFLFGATHTTNLTEMATVFQNGGFLTETARYGADRQVTIPATVQALNPVWVFMGFGLLFVGACFKLSLAPFHMYAPDVYEGSNTPTTMLIATGSKVAAFAFLVHVVEAMSYWAPFAQGASFIIGLAAVASMLWGNLAAVVQSNIKRMLAYSSVAHTGYTAVGVLVLVALPSLGLGDRLTDAQIAVREAIIFYLAGYTIMNILAFGIAHYIGGEGQMGAYRGLVHRKPLAAIGMAIAMFSLLGIPPTVGFMGKFWVFKEAVEHGFIGITVIAVLASSISAWYYLSLVVTMFMREEEEPAGVPLAGTGAGAARMVSAATLSRAFLIISCVLVVLFGIIPTLFFALQFTDAAILGAR